jgi:hypothetical protein
MPDASDILIKLYDEQRSMVRHHEQQRATISNFLITIAAGLLGLIAHFSFAKDTFGLAVALVFLGIYGGLICEKHYERSRFHASRAQKYRGRIAELVPDAQINQLHILADAEHRSKFPHMEKKHLHSMWLILHAMISLAGLACALAIILK